MTNRKPAFQRTIAKKDDPTLIEPKHGEAGNRTPNLFYASIACERNVIPLDHIPDGERDENISHIVAKERLYCGGCHAVRKNECGDDREIA